MMKTNNLDIAAPLLAWYDRHRRVLPWRAEPGQTVDPYRVWVSEIMLQQTVVTTVIPYFLKFMERWPNVEALAAADLDSVLTAWAGLGYYARGRNLHACARQVVARFSGRFPPSLDQLRSLPGIGEYTAGAIASIAFALPHAAVDGNVERVVARLLRLEDPIPECRPAIRSSTQAMVPRLRAGDFAQAMMDLGATICTPSRPKCLMCPLSAVCTAYRSGDQERLPVRKRKPDRPVRFGRVYWIRNQAGEILVRARPETGLLGGMLEFPSSSWTEMPVDTMHVPPFAAEWRLLPGSVVHVFTHFRLELDIVSTTLATRSVPMPGKWVAASTFGQIALPSVMKKVATLAIAQTR